MMQWTVLYRKEMAEMRRTFKWMWLPLVFVLFGVMQPVVMYYLPQIIEAAGNLPEGAVFEFPTPSGGEVMTAVLDQFGTVGILLIVLAGMGIVASEKQNRTVSLVMVRPVSSASFITAKWAAYLTLGLVSFIIGCLSGWYYTELLIGEVAWQRVIEGASIFGLWLVFIMTVTVLMSTVLRSSGAVAFMSLLVVIGLLALSSLFKAWMTWSPSKLSGHAYQLLSSGSVGDHFVLNIIVSLLLIAVMLAAAVAIFGRQELAD